MENPKCPYCGEEQYLTIEDHREIGRMEYYMCIHCGSRSPAKTTIEEAYAAAMKRDRAKGKTYAEDFFSKYPNAPHSTKNGMETDRPAACRVVMYGGSPLCIATKCDCAVCWNEEMENEDE